MRCPGPGRAGAFDERSSRVTAVAPPPPPPSSSESTVVHVAVSDPRVDPLLRELGDEYATRYGEEAHAELARHPDEEFTAPLGGVASYGASWSAEGCPPDAGRGCSAAARSTPRPRSGTSSPCPA
ncbi:hypothetical protein GCM10027162_45250 [Streptomyces incanus]